MISNVRQSFQFFRGKLEVGVGDPGTLHPLNETPCVVYMYLCVSVGGRRGGGRLLISTHLLTLFVVCCVGGTVRW